MMITQHLFFYFVGAEEAHLYYHYHEHLGVTVQIVVDSFQI